MPTDPRHVTIVRQLLAQLGVTIDDLHNEADQRPSTPTIAEYLPKVVAAAGLGAARTYGTYWNRMAAAWSTRPLDTITASDIEALQRDVAANAVPDATIVAGATPANTSSPPPALSTTAPSPTAYWTPAPARHTASPNPGDYPAPAAR